ncbi:MAG TPA: CsbD family protein [Candidatus Acidoferrum sp.]|nr:CsbD family protein [Candidatus Acidoferrum sp.]
MKPSTKDKTKGKFHQLKGALKAKVGKATNNRRLQAAGIGEEVAGQIQLKLGKAETILEKQANRRGL